MSMQKRIGNKWAQIAQVGGGKEKKLWAWRSLSARRKLQRRKVAARLALLSWQKQMLRGRSFCSRPRDLC